MSDADSTYNKALSYTHRLFNYRPRSEKELRERLGLRGFNDSVIERVIAEYKQKRLLDDGRFAMLWVSSRLYKKASSLKQIKYELAAKGINKEIIDEAVDRASEGLDEYEIAKGLAEKRKPLLAGVNRLKSKKRLFDYLLRRGFSADIVYKVINEIYTDADA